MHPGLLPPWGSSLIYIISTICVIFLILTHYKIIQRLCLAFAIGPNRRRQVRRNSRRQRHTNENILNEAPSQVQSVGLASAVIHSLPAIQFREEIKKGRDQDNTDCAVCLGEFGEGEWLRLLPNCAHVFHVACIDTWFRAHSTCPLCRMDVLYDFSSCSSSSVSMVALLATLRREDPYDERPLGHRLLDAVTMQNPEYRLGAISSHLLETDSDESAPAISPIIIPNIIATENQLEVPQNHKGESSRSERNEQAMSASTEVSH